MASCSLSFFIDTLGKCVRLWLRFRQSLSNLLEQIELWVKHFTSRYCHDSIFNLIWDWTDRCSACVREKEQLTSSSWCHLHSLPHLFVCNPLLLRYSAPYLLSPQQWSPHPSTRQMSWTDVRQWPNNLCKWKRMQNLFLPEHIFP